MFQIEIDSNVFDVTNELIGRLRDFSPALSEVGAYLERQAKLRIAQQKDPQGNPFEPLAPSTVADKRRRGAPDKILVDQGFLESAFFFTVGSDEVRLKNSQEYLIWLQRGTRQMPARPPMGFEDGDTEVILRILRRHISG